MPSEFHAVPSRRAKDTRSALLAPKVLAPVLTKVVPDALGGNGTLLLSELDDIDDQARLDAHRAGLRASVRAVIHARLRSLPQEVLLAPLPSPAAALQTLPLENRTSTALARILPAPPADGLWTLGRYLTLSGFGAGCLIDLLRSVQDAAAGRASELSIAEPLAERTRACLAALHAQLPLTEEAAHRVLTELPRPPLDVTLASLVRAAETAGWPVPFRTVKHGGRTFLVPAEQVAAIAAAHAAAVRFVRQWGVASIAQVVGRVRIVCGLGIDGRTISAVLSALPSFSWLEPRFGWFWLRDCPNRLVRILGKIFSVARRLRVTEVAQAALRAYGAHHRPGRRALETACAQLAGSGREGAWITRNEPLMRQEWLSPSELLLVSLLEHNGGAISIPTLRRLARLAGIAKATFEVTVRRSPVMTLVDRNHLAVVGWATQGSTTTHAPARLLRHRPRHRVPLGALSSRKAQEGEAGHLARRRHASARAGLVG